MHDWDLTFQENERLAKDSNEIVRSEVDKRKKKRSEEKSKLRSRDACTAQTRPRSRSKE